MGFFDFLRRGSGNRDEPDAARAPAAPRELRTHVAPYGEPSGPPPTELFAAAGLTAEPVFIGRTEDAGDIWAVVAEPTVLAGAWSVLADQHPTTGFWPVVLSAYFGPDHYDLEGAADEVAAAREADGRQVLDHWKSTTRQSIPQGDEPFPPPQETSGELHGVLALVATRDPWLVPALLGYLGAVNLGPTGRDISAALRLWSDRYGARLVSLDEASMDLAISRPPTDEQEALAVARDHAGFCPDAVEPHSLRAWTATVRSHRWSFWWD